MRAICCHLQLLPSRRTETSSKERPLVLTTQKIQHQTMPMSMSPSIFFDGTGFGICDDSQLPNGSYTVSDLKGMETSPCVNLGDVNRVRRCQVFKHCQFVDILNNNRFQVEADICLFGKFDILDVAPFIGILAVGW